MSIKREYVLIVSSDIPAITGEMVDWVVDSSSRRSRMFITT
jgi:GTP:adenosylcobinamide-phosphate guanylyltransferase